MYQQHFNFTSLPFSIAPNPRFVYLSPQHREALAHLLFGISAGGGFVALTGEVGTGKTTLCRCLLEQLPDDVDIALIFNPRLSAKELLASICDELRIPHPEHRASIKQLIDRLNHHLLETHARGRRTVVLIDEAQNLSYDVLEQIRLLTNLETNETKLLQIILVGQPELKSLLDRRTLRQLAQRITARYHLLPLSFQDTVAYINHRLEVSGASQTIFSRRAVAQVYRLSGGIPRLINLICDRALLGAYTLGKQAVNPAIVRKAAREALPEAPHHREKLLALGLAAAVALFGVLHYLGYGPLVGTTLPELAPAEPTAKANQAVAAPTPTPIAIAAAPSPAPPAPSPSPAVTPEPSASAAPAAEPPAAGPTPPPTSTAESKAQEASTPEKPFPELVSEAPAGDAAAFASLFALWGVAPPTQTTDDCLYARHNGLRCLNLSTDWPQLQALNRPALLELAPPGGSRRYAAVTGLTGNMATLQLGGRAYTLPLAEILPFWRGQAVILWKPIGDKAFVALGDKGETVLWVRRLLKVPAAPGADSIFDEKLKASVIAFQLQKGLQADGQVGPLTMLHLEQLDESPETPRLQPHAN